ncbi:hypothetical protein [Vallitalea sp.]|jgi:hypothetical protein|uniref:hypothetical protein n=1 Tax=Vallitalea sp. TaxID=1882829 RepID=UPI0025DCB7C9|nr:hypothetical protein [Vallitalea sp.]MCT4687093.1 hypothetical protein [Vallitalea sp.]
MKKVLGLLLAGSLILSQGIIANAAYREYIEDEYNDTMENADKYNVYESNTYVYGTVNDYDDTDYFKLVATTSGEMDIDLYFDEASSDIDIDFYIYDSSEDILTKISNCDGSENYRTYVDENDYVYVRVDYDSGNLAEPYELCFDMD